MNRIGVSARKVCLLLTAGALIWLVRSQPADTGNPGPCGVTSQIVDINGDLETHIHYPSGDQCGGGITAPYPTIAFAHGFSMFGLTNGARDSSATGNT